MSAAFTPEQEQRVRELIAEEAAAAAEGCDRLVRGLLEIFEKSAREIRSIDRAAEWLKLDLVGRLQEGPRHAS